MIIPNNPVLGLAKGYSEKEIEVGGDRIMQWTLSFDIGRHGAFVDGNLVFSENEALYGLRDISDTKRFAEMRHLELVRIETTQYAQHDRIVIKSEEVTQSHYPHGVIADYTIDMDGLSILIESLDRYSNDSINIRLQVKHRQIVAIPIISKGILVGVGVVINVSDAIKEKGYRTV